MTDDWLERHPYLDDVTPDGLVSVRVPLSPPQRPHPVSVPKDEPPQPHLQEPREQRVWLALLCVFATEGVREWWRPAPNTHPQRRASAFCAPIYLPAARTLATLHFVLLPPLFPRD